MVAVATAFSWNLDTVLMQWMQRPSMRMAYDVLEGSVIMEDYAVIPQALQ